MSVLNLLPTALSLALPAASDSLASVSSLLGGFVCFHIKDFPAFGERSRNPIGNPRKNAFEVVRYCPFR